jgi:hypothetical protein
LHERRHFKEQIINVKETWNLWATREMNVAGSPLVLFRGPIPGRLMEKGQSLVIWWVGVGGGGWKDRRGEYIFTEEVRTQSLFMSAVGLDVSLAEL